MVCRGLDLDLSGKVAKKTTDTEKRSPRPHSLGPPHPSPSYRYIRNLSLSTADAAATAYTRIIVAIVTRSHFGNAKPKFYMKCWPAISNFALTTEAVSIAVIYQGPQAFLTCTYSFIFTNHYRDLYKSTGKQEECTPVQLSLRTVKHTEQN